MTYDSGKLLQKNCRGLTLSRQQLLKIRLYTLFQITSSSRTAVGIGIFMGISMGMGWYGDSD